MHLDAKARQQLQRDLDVGLGDQLAHHVDDDVLRPGRQRQRHQQRGEELAGDVAAHRDRLIKSEIRLADVQGRKAVLTQILHVAAQRPQRIDQIANRPFVHARNAA